MIRRSVLMYRDIFYNSMYTWKIHLFSLSLPNCFTSLVDFQTACKKLWCQCILAGSSNSKNPNLYYFTNADILNWFWQQRWCKSSNISILIVCKLMAILANWKYSLRLKTLESLRKRCQSIYFSELNPNNNLSRRH